MTNLIAGMSNLWRGIQICPLFLIIADECPSTVTKDITELCAWLRSIYVNNPLGLIPVWTAVIAALEKFSLGATPLSAPDYYKAPLPKTLSSLDLDSTTTFGSLNTRLVSLKGLPKDIQGELLWSLVDILCNVFHVCISPENYLGRATIESQVETTVGAPKVVLIGASNLRKCSSHFETAGKEIFDLTEPGWVHSPENVARIINKVTEMDNVNDDLFVVDLYGNSSFHYE
jgi:hypothetical protein